MEVKVNRMQQFIEEFYLHTMKFFRHSAVLRWHIVKEMDSGNLSAKCGKTHTENVHNKIHTADCIAVEFSTFGWNAPYLESLCGHCLAVVVADHLDSVTTK